MYGIQKTPAESQAPQAVGKVVPRIRRGLQDPVHPAIQYVTILFYDPIYTLVEEGSKMQTPPARIRGN